MEIEAAPGKVDSDHIRAHLGQGHTAKRRCHEG
jgi:hypothetical protein